jgi:hypothetical protein
MTVIDEWRLTIEVTRDSGERFWDVLWEHAAAALVTDRLTDAAAVHREGKWVRAYAPSYDSLRHAQEVLALALEQTSTEAEESCEHFHQARGAWVPVELPPLPERATRRIKRHDGPEGWGAEAETDRVQLRFECSDHVRATEFAKALAFQGFEVHRRWTSVFLFADDRQQAEYLRLALNQQAPPDTQAFLMDEGQRTLWV